MPAVYIDQSQVRWSSVSCQDTDGSQVDTMAFVVPVVIPADQIGEWEAAYDSASLTSPSEANSRIIARAVLDGLNKAAEIS